MKAFRKGLLAPLPLVAALTILLILPVRLLTGHWSWPSGWVFVVVHALAAMAGSAFLAMARPASFQVRQQGLLAERDKKQPLIDAIGLLVYLIFAVGWVVLIPFDVFRLHLLPTPPASVSALGGGMLLSGMAVVHLAVAQNRFAAPTIHDQIPEGQRVIDTGLYGLVRHPFYAGMLLVYAGMAVWLGSYAALIGVVGFLLLTLARIAFEEVWLRAHLPAYADYARRVRGRLIPGLL